MKTAIYQSTRRQPKAIPFPNAASRKYFVQKFLDLALLAAIGAGIGACILFLSVLA